jgi:glucose/arabinose dehydrogenase
MGNGHVLRLDPLLKGFEDQSQSLTSAAAQQKAQKTPNKRLATKKSPQKPNKRRVKAEEVVASADTLRNKHTLRRGGYEIETKNKKNDDAEFAIAS